MSKAAAFLISLVALTGCATKTASPDASVSAIPAGAATVSSGTFSGRNDHVVTGLASVKAADGVYYVEFDSGFSLDGAPDPKVGFGNRGVYDPATTFSPLKHRDGAQSYRVPDHIDPSTYGEVYIWCDQFSVALGIAPLN